MDRPLVSICLPNLNTLPYLPERMDTIFDQTFKDWELIVSDNFSDDGAWQFFESVASKDSRVSIMQEAPRGMYANWNNCIRRARGKYVYIATSDDTMAPDCLEKLASALEGHPECDLAHCKIKVIDQSGRELDWWLWREGLFVHSSGELLEVPHLRKAPFDGLLHLAGRTVYLSITQLLIRRDLFEKIGLFESKWGSIGDFNWGMRAGLVANTVHVPDTWGGWRNHPSQASSTGDHDSPEYDRKIQEMIDHAIQTSRPSLAPATFERLQSAWAPSAKRRRRLEKAFSNVRLSRFEKVVNEPRNEPRSAGARHRFSVRDLLKATGVAPVLARARLAKRSYWPKAATKWARQTGMKTILVPV
jgi:glycosyltransferase involved in cell wall biosynthesis